MEFLENFAKSALGSALFTTKVNGIEKILSTMNTFERKALFEALKGRYCMKCGTPKGEPCDCDKKSSKTSKSSKSSKPSGKTVIDVEPNE